MRQLSPLLCNLPSLSNVHSATYPYSTHGEVNQSVLVDDERQEGASGNCYLTCSYFDLQDRLTTLNYHFPNNEKWLDDNQSWVTLIDERELTFLRDKVTFQRGGQTYSFSVHWSYVKRQDPM